MTTQPAPVLDFLAELDAEVPGWENAEWDRAMSLLKAFIAVHGHARVPAIHVQDGFPLGRWVHERRRARRGGRLSIERIAELDAIGFIWGPQDAAWQRGIDALRSFIARTGHALVPVSHIENGHRLGAWVSTQRYARGNNVLSADRVAELDALGFIWDAYDISWQRGTDALRAYVAANGHARVPLGHVEDGFPLGTWVGTQRKERKNSRLSTDRIAELDALGFIWGASHRDSWQRGTDALRTYIAANGHARVPFRHVEDGFNLGGWVHTRRTARKGGKLSDERIAELDALGFIWIINDGNGWQRGIDALRAFIAANSHARVPQSHVENGHKLGNWVSNQRQERKDGKLSDARIAELDALGFIWDARPCGPTYPAPVMNGA